jgi:hypothetical protein
VGLSTNYSLFYIYFPTIALIETKGNKQSLLPDECSYQGTIKYPAYSYQMHYPEQCGVLLSRKSSQNQSLMTINGMAKFGNDCLFSHIGKLNCTILIIFLYTISPKLAALAISRIRASNGCHSFFDTARFSFVILHILAIFLFPSF